MGDTYYLFCDHPENVDTEPFADFVGRVAALEEDEFQLLMEALGDWAKKLESDETAFRPKRESDVSKAERLQLL